MKRRLRVLLWNRNKKLPLWLAAMGFTLGLFLLFGVLRFHGEVMALFHPDRHGTDSRFMMINKKVSLKHTLGLGHVSFSAEELACLKQQDFVLDVGTIVTTNFTVLGFASFGLAGEMQSELFFEAVDDRFLDTHPVSWHWQEGDTQIPVIVARQFLAIYNFGYASAKGFPQLTEKTMGLLPAQVLCKGEIQQFFSGKIVGFSDRFFTILVPMSFMNWANAQIGQQAAPPVSRVILEIKSGQEEAVQAFLDHQSYETNQERLPIEQAGRTLKVVLVVVSGFGGILILVSGLSLVLFLQLLISQAQPELQRLHQLGFDDAFLAGTYVRVMLPAVIAPFVLAGVGVGVMGYLLEPVFMKIGLVIAPHLDFFTGGGIVTALLVTVGLLYGLVYRYIQCIGNVASGEGVGKANV